MPTFCSWPASLPAFPAALPPGLLGSVDGSQLSPMVAGVAVVVAGLIVGVVAWQLGRSRQRRSNLQALQAVKQITALIEHTDCLIWEARVQIGPQDWTWEFTLHVSVLSRKLFGEQLPPKVVGLWNRLDIPEMAEMDRRSREALENKLPGYVQQFQVIQEGKIRWLREEVSITPTEPNRFWLAGLVTDITAQRESEQARRASEEQMNQLMTHANCLLWQAHVTRDEAGQFNWEWFVPRSELYRRMMGENPDQQAIMPWGVINVPEFPELEARSRDAMVRGLPGYEQVFRVIKDDKVLWMHEQASITRLGDNRWKIEGVVIDITAQRQAEEAQRKSERRLEQLLERADCTIWQGQVTRLADGDMQWRIYIPSSSLYRRIRGGEPPNAEGFDWGRLQVPEYEEMMRRCREALLNNASGYEQVFHIARDGGDLWLAEQVSINPVGPGSWDLIGIITDITARHDAEEARRSSQAQLQQILELADCMVWEGTATPRSDGNLEWKMFTPRSMLSRRLFGEEVGGETIDWKRLDVPETEEMSRRADHAIRTKAPGYVQEFRVILPLRVTWLHEVVTIVYEPNGRSRMVGVITDITAQREAQEARRASEDQVRQILATADCLLWQARVFIIGPENLRWVMFVPPSRLYRELFGSDPPDPPALLWLEVVDEATNRENNARSTQAILSGAPGYEHEFCAQRGDRVFWLHETVAIIPVGPGEWRLVGVMTDVTARRAAEEAWKSSEGRLQKLLTRADCLLWEAKVELTEDNWKWDFEIQPSGLRQKLYGPPESDDATGLWRRFNIPEWAEMGHRCKTAMTEGRPGYEQIFHIIKEDGSIIWIQETVSIRQISPERFSLVGVATDITRQQGAEAALAAEKERLAVTLQAMAEGVVTTDIAGRVQFINPAARAITQWEEGAIGRPVTDIFLLENDRTGVAIEVPVAQVARGDAVVELPARTRLVTRNGQQRLVDGCCAPIHSADSQVIGMVFVLRDITEHERLEQELIRATRLESVGILAGGIAHDFNNILTGVMGNLALAQLDVDASTDCGARLRDAEKAALRARDLTQQLLTFAKGGEPIREALHLEAILRDTTSFALHGSNVLPVYHIPADLWSVDADKGQIGRVVQNLVINAVQAMSAGGTLRLNASNDRIAAPGRPGLIPGDYVQIAIADTGEGIKADHLTRIFDPYFTTKQTGTGLGLAAVYSIVKKHRGYIDVESRPGHGSTFRVWLPALREKGVESAPPMPVALNQFAGRVLFMDDEESIRRMAAQILQRLGFVVEVAVDGAEAVEKFRAARAAGQPHSLVIMDLTVPGGIGGREAIAQLLEIEPQVRAIVSSGYSSDPVLANYRDHGFCGMVAKPYRMDDFIKAIQQALSAPPV